MRYSNDRAELILEFLSEINRKLDEQIAKLDAFLAKLSPEQAEILAAVMAQHPTLTRQEALQHLREMGL